MVTRISVNDFLQSTGFDSIDDFNSRLDEEGVDGMMEYLGSDFSSNFPQGTDIREAFEMYFKSKEQILSIYRRLGISI